MSTTNLPIGDLLASLRRLRLVEPAKAQTGAEERAVVDDRPARERPDASVQQGSRQRAIGLENQQRARVLPLTRAGAAHVVDDHRAEADAIRSARERAATALREHPPEDADDTYAYEDSLSTYKDLVSLQQRMEAKGAGTLEGYVEAAARRSADAELLVRSIEQALVGQNASNGDTLTLQAAGALRDHAQLELQSARAKQKLLLMGYSFLDGDGRIDDVERASIDAQTRAIFALDARVLSADGRVEAMHVASEDPTLRGNLFAPDAAARLIDRRQEERRAEDLALERAPTPVAFADERLERARDVDADEFDDEEFARITDAREASLIEHGRVERSRVEESRLDERRKRGR
jgi:hypothetical protein